MKRKPIILHIPYCNMQRGCNEAFQTSDRDRSGYGVYSELIHPMQEQLQNYVARMLYNDSTENNSEL